jgi:hypothetical protein
MLEKVMMQRNGASFQVRNCVKRSRVIECGTRHQNEQAKTDELVVKSGWLA